MPIFFGSVLFIVISLAVLALAAITFAPVILVPLALLLVVLVALGIRARVNAARAIDNSGGPQARWREEAAAVDR